MLSVYKGSKVLLIGTCRELVRIKVSIHIKYIHLKHFKLKK